VQIIADLANGVPVPQKNPLWWHQNTILKNLVQIMASSFFRKFLQLGRLCQKGWRYSAFESRTSIIFTHLKLHMNLLFNISTLHYNAKWTSVQKCNVITG